MNLIEISRAEFSAFPELAQLVEREGAWRVALAEYPLEDQYVAVKAPTLDGTEIWIVAASAQESFELAQGFAKKSQPLITFSAERLPAIQSAPFRSTQ